MANNAGATTHKTPPRNSALSAEAGLKSTPHAVGSAVVSEHISTVGVEVNNVRPWITRDVQKFQKCEADTMLQELLARCTGSSQSLSPSEKLTLLETSLKAVLPICNVGAVAQDIKGHLTDFCDIELETATYAPFIRATNCALRELSEVKVPGIPAFKVDDKTNILLQVNDPMPIYQNHQGKQSERKPDIVVVSHQTALGADAHQMQESQVLAETACKPPKDNFQWTNVRSTLELKRARKPLNHPPAAYKTDYVVPPPSAQYMEYVKDLNAPAKATGSTPATGSAQTPHGASNELRPSSQQLSKGVKRKRAGNSENQTEEKEPRKPHPVVQNGLYVAEMFAAHIARQHVISFIVNNDYIYVWFFDREDAIQGAAINFIQDLPRLLVLLFIMQRMRYKQWGLSPVFEPEPGFSGKVMVKDTQIDLELDVKSDEQQGTIRSAAGSRFPNESPELVAKLYWPEETRQSEPDILNEVYKIAQTDPDVRGHVPELVWFHKFEGTSTSKIRIALGLKDAKQAKQGSRALYIIVFRKLIPITTLSGKEFLAAWWQIVKCHRALWKEGVHHRDVSPSNLMGYLSCGQFIGVLNDYDLSSFQRDSPSSLERTGTVPFMAVDLLTLEAIAGKVEHVYAHDAESFIWVLTWVCLRYEGGNLLSKNRPLDEWLKIDAIRCSEEKTHFWSVGLSTMRPSRSHEGSWDVVKKCFLGIHSLYSPLGYRKLGDQSAFELLLEEPIQGHL
ncbi:hypothetical protein EV702DRAFT_1281245 [Suillus placidus]|uniref:Fungal-type protein kinase domain-containing protein n=1 Tax=Suillus placidus TaxID=48579 RepID=A0A9P7CZ46_9AGAM|nr:hypothetical protein EV702DRAFT_1281245 [Suillus placidus]